MRAVRITAWIVLLVLAGAQAWSARFYASPDGISYLDISDGLLAGNFGELLNTYWSPLYPALIGAFRAILRPSPYWEFAVVHLINFVLFIVSLVGFEYFLSELRRLADSLGRPGLGTPWGMAGAYAVFGVFTLTMTPLVLPTPDLLVSASCFFVFGALLRLRFADDAARAGVVLGLALAAGSLAKSFVIPWAGVCVLTALVARRHATRPAIVAAAIWLLAAAPWTLALSASAGRITFGDTGRLTYIWYVNQVESPSRKNMPHAAATPATDSILEGVAVTADAPGTNPVWYDPARWYTDLEPRFVLSRQLEVLGALVGEYIASLAPLLLVLGFWLIVAGRRELAEWWGRAWVVMVPSVVAILAYSMVLVTTRYVAPFYMAMTLMVMALVRWPERIGPAQAAAGVGVPLFLMMLAPDPEAPVALVNAAAGSVLAVWVGRHRTAAVMIVLGVTGALAIRVLQPQDQLVPVAGLSALVILGYWGAARASERRGESELYSALTKRAVLAASASLIVIVAALKYGDGLTHERAEAGEPNNSWLATSGASAAGIGAGDRIALVGSPFEAYWVRMGGARIVAVVPPPRMAAFNALSAGDQQRLYAEFRKAGATHVVVQQADPPVSADRSWAPVRYIGWVKSVE